MPETEPEEVDTSVSTKALLRLINQRARCALDDDHDTEAQIQSIIDVTDNILSE